jgi:hypothetical protein
MASGAPAEKVKPLTAEELAVKKANTIASDEEMKAAVDVRICFNLLLHEIDRVFLFAL